jgi:hypothetical protein
MAGMPGPVITVSPYWSVADLDRMVRRSLEQHGVAQLAARTSDGRQRAQLGRIGRHLAMDSRLEVRGADHTDGYSYVTVIPAGAEPRGPLRAGWWGEPKGVHETDPDWQRRDEWIWQISEGYLPRGHLPR